PEGRGLQRPEAVARRARPRRRARGGRRGPVHARRRDAMSRATLAAAALAPAAPAARADDPQVIPDVVYGHKDGLALTYDVLKPAKPSGAAILWIQSGGWYSGYADPKNLVGASKGFLDKGYTVVIVRHGSAPKYT